MVGGKRPLQLKFVLKNYPPPFEKRQLQQISTYNISTIKAKKNVHLSGIGSRTRAFQQTTDEVCTLPKSLKEWLKSRFVVICPIAIAYSYGTDNKIGLRLSVCLSVCPCVITLTVAFLCRFSPNLTQRCKPPKVRTSSLGVNIVLPLPLFYP